MYTYIGFIMAKKERTCRGSSRQIEKWAKKQKCHACMESCNQLNFIDKFFILSEF